MMNRLVQGVVGLSLLTLVATGCGTATGAAVGAGAGAAVGAGTGYGAGKGALIGTGVDPRRCSRRPGTRVGPIRRFVDRGRTAFTHRRQPGVERLLRGHEHVVLAQLAQESGAAHAIANSGARVGQTELDPLRA